MGRMLLPLLVVQLLLHAVLRVLHSLLLPIVLVLRVLLLHLLRPLLRHGVLRRLRRCPVLRGGRGAEAGR